MRRGRTSQDGRIELRRRLESRRGEIEAAAIARVHGIADPSAISDQSYLSGLRVSVAAALDYGLAGVATSAERAIPPPVALLAQARLAARCGVGLDVVLRRYCAGHALFADFLLEEARRCELRGEVLQLLMRTQATMLDRLLAAVAPEHAEEREKSRMGTSRQRLVERVERLIDGELPDALDIPYDFEGYHLGIVAAGPGGEDTVRGGAEALDCIPLVVPRGEQAVWAWLGSSRPPDPAKLRAALAGSTPPGASLAFGEPGRGLAGWRLTHRQAIAAAAIGHRESQCLVRYSDVALLASILHDELLATSLQQRYLTPLENERDRGETFRRTLKAYFDANGNTSSAAAALGVTRHTVSSRLRAIEETLAVSLDSHAAEIAVALRLHAIDGHRH